MNHVTSYSTSVVDVTWVGFKSMFIYDYCSTGLNSPEKKFATTIDFICPVKSCDYFCVDLITNKS